MPAYRALIDSCPLLFKSAFTVENAAWLEMVCSGKRRKQSLKGSSESSLLVALSDGFSLGDFSKVLPGLFHRRHFKHAAEYMKSIVT